MDSMTLKQEAQELLEGFWVPAILAVVAVDLMLMGAASFVIVGAWILSGPLNVGLAVFFLDLAHRREAGLEKIFVGFERFGKTMTAGLVVALYVFLWSLLLIVPGVIAAMAYSQTFFLMAKDPQLDPMEAIRRSREMMMGYKGKLFELILSFFGWFLLCAVTCGIAVIYVGPYFSATMTRFHLALTVERGQA